MSEHGPRAQTPPGAPRILVAEPSRTLAALIRASLAELSADVELCADGAQALSSARSRAPDVLICDEKLGGLDGYALAHAMRQLASERRVATLLMVSEHGHPDPERLAYVGVADVLTKPFERAVLLERVRALLPRLEVPRLTYESAPARHTFESEAPEYGSRYAPGHGATPATHGPPTWERERARPVVEPIARAPLTELAPGQASQMAELRRLSDLVAQLERRLAGLDQLVDQKVEQQVEQRVESRLSTALAQRLPTLVDAALARLMPSVVAQAVERAVERAVSDRVPSAVAAVVDEARHTLGGLASSEEVERLVRSLAQDTVATVLGKEVLTLVPQALSEVRAHIESELLTRLDRFARTELPQKLTSHAEQIVWKVVPTIAEDLVREELKRLTAD